ncbi:MAG: c-type cytochrome [Myxococcales bacterium]|nr:c-type cytochrome [Myxococcales bacterium]
MDEPTAERYLGDGAFRRGVLERSLWRPDLPYSRSLLASYALGDAGWDLLSPMTELTALVTRADSEALQAGRALSLDDAEPVAGAGSDVDALPSDEAAWVALGKRVFERLPMRPDGFLRYLVGTPEIWQRVGIRERADGTLRGIVKYRDVRGDVRVGLTCALCHASPSDDAALAAAPALQRNGDSINGRADRGLDLGLARALASEASGVSADPRLRSWGAGRVDVTDDGVNTPTAVPDLWAMPYKTHLNHSGVIKIVSPATSAVRFETQYVLGHRMETRPRRALTWALSRYIAALQPPAPPSAPSVPPSAELARGKALFGERCASCHRPDRGFAGEMVLASQLMHDPAVATTPERGTGYYKVPSLVGVRYGAPYLHDGSEPTLASLLERGHPRGRAISGDDQRALIAYLETL